MQIIVIDRRRFLIGTLAFSATSIIENRQLAVADALSDWLTAPVTSEKELLSPQIVGQLSADIIQRFGRFSAFLIKAWDLEIFVEAPVDQIAELFVVKSAENPSYFTEYGVLNESIERAKASLNSEDRAFDLLAFGAIPDPQPLFSRLGRFRRFMFAETARYIISAGGFKRFRPATGIEPARNYQGYIAGPFTNPSYLPYRGIEK